MKWMIASDIHGSAKWCEKLIEAWRTERPGRLVLLGDLLYHGPRNDLPEDYAPKKVIAMLNAIAPELLCVRGNCEAEVDQMVLDFPVMADYAVLCVDGHTIYVTHGHVHGEDAPPPLKDGDILLCGHTHVPGLRRHEGYTYMNPGSVSIPKNGSAHSYVTLEDGLAAWKDLGNDCAVYDTHRLW
ncbi:MAG: phosphodiesterase [Clostridia bacterium]|nr:phosphodiesterase [Clostridia bacterium]